LCFLNEPRAKIPWFSKEMRLRTLEKIAKFCREYIYLQTTALAQSKHFEQLEVNKYTGVVSCSRMLEIESIA